MQKLWVVFTSTDTCGRPLPRSHINSTARILTDQSAVSSLAHRFMSSNPSSLKFLAACFKSHSTTLRGFSPGGRPRSSSDLGPVLLRTSADPPFGLPLTPFFQFGLGPG